MADDQASGGGKGPALGLVGAVIAIISIWWFALRPRLRRPPDDGAPPAEG